MNETNNWVYISGSISNGGTQEPDFSGFYEAEKMWEDKGYQVFNPARLEHDGATWEWYMARDLEFIMNYRPDLYMLKTWKNSKGAKLERELAKRMGLNIYYEEPYEPRP